MSGKNETEKRTDAVLWRWAGKKHTALHFIAAGAGLVLLGFFLGGYLCRP